LISPQGTFCDRSVLEDFTAGLVATARVFPAAHVSAALAVRGSAALF
jgi:hypothetical protein